MEGKAVFVQSYFQGMGVQVVVHNTFAPICGDARNIKKRLESGAIGLGIAYGLANNFLLQAIENFRTVIGDVLADNIKGLLLFH
jgi:hypothetical protein